MSIISRLKRHKAYSNYVIMSKFFGIMGVKPIHIILPVFLSFIAASFDGISLGLLVPLVKGVVSNNFYFIKEAAGLKYIVKFFPGVLLNTDSPNKNAFLFLIGLVLLFVVLKNALNYITSVLSAYWHGRFGRNIYLYVFERFLTFGKMFFDRTSEGYLIMIMNYSEYTMKVLRTFENSVNQIFTLAIYFTVMLMISWKLTIVTLIVFPILHYLLKAIVSRLYSIAQLTNASMIALQRNVFNILSCIPLVKVYSKEDEMKANFRNINEELRKLNLRSDKVGDLINPIQEIVVTLALLFMLAIVALLFAEGKPAEISVFVVFFYAAKRALPMFNIFNIIKTDFAQAKPPLRELYKVFDDTDKFVVAQGPETFKELQSGIELKGLNFSYVKGRRVLNDVNLYMEKGKVTALVGPSGAGKTTIVNLIVRFYDCPPGSIMVDNIDIRNFTLKSLRREMALVSQEALLLNDTLRNNITFGLDRKITDEELIDVSKKARLYDFILQLPAGFDTEVGDRGVKLSGGEKQRVAIARALLKKSEILILDEATSSLDTKTEQLIQAAIDEAIKGKTTIVIAHRLSTVKHADKIIVIEDGRIAEQGSLNELLKKEGRFYRYWEDQKFF
ncbi:MAG: ABC transporter ATP-binding protein [Candidatus Omnitrophota bacterium]|jgi:subfamily B ATP-binding cassette protein MsbA|nr:ABC transporter ATP-binding protein [Candidatus Omnitrophota bacterium]